VDANSIYYTLSTIAQTLAGALAVLVAVVLFRYTAFIAAMEGAKAEMRARGIDVARAWPVLRDRGLAELTEHLKTHQAVGPSWSENTKQMWEAAHRAYQDWGRTNIRLYLVVGTAAVDIALCFLALPITPRLVGAPRLATAILAFACLLGILCIALFIWLVVGLVKRLEV